MKRLLGMFLVLLLLGVVPAFAQVLGTGVTPVVEVGPQVQHSAWTAAQSTISAVEDVFQSAQWVLDLTPFDEMVLGTAFLDTVATLNAIVIEAEGLSYDLGSIQAQVEALFDPTTAPTTPVALTERVVEMRHHLFVARCYATKAQTLLSTVNGALEHLANLVHLIGSLRGNMQGNQLIVQMQALTNQQLATQTALHASHQRAEVMEKLQRDLILVSLHNIEASRWATMPAK